MEGADLSTVAASLFPSRREMALMSGMDGVESRLTAVRENRAHPQWALTFCLDYFDLPAQALQYVAGGMGQRRLQELWGAVGPELYQSPWYLLRQELFHTGHTHRRYPVFFSCLASDAVLLDWGCGTAEMERLDWIDKGRPTVLMDCKGLPLAYLRAKYPHPHVTVSDSINALPERYDAVICTHVFEHIPRPLDLLEALWDGLTPGGHALFWFEGALLSPGHLEASIDDIPRYWEFLASHADPICFTGSYDWVQKPKGARTRTWPSLDFLATRALDPSRRPRNPKS